jgi:hemoglobin
MGVPPSGWGHNRGDISSPADVNLLVRRFYQAAIPDPLLGPVFRSAGIDWSVHVPLLCAFWEHLLLGSSDYQGNVVRAHMAILPRAPFGSAHLGRWLELFEETVDEWFAGPTAERAKYRARQVAAAIAAALDRVHATPEQLRPPRHRLDAASVGTAER